MQIEDLIRKYDKNVPRYTSYPTANHFSDHINSPHHQRWLPNVSEDDPVSIYLHIPFCQSMCRYCGCHTRVLKDYEPARAYVDSLRREIESVAFLLGAKRKAGFIHWGGGTPTFLDESDMAGIMDTLHCAFDIDASAEHAMEIDPRTLDHEKTRFLAGIGVNRASLGVQDFDSDVQEAIDRKQPYEMVRDVVEWLREAGINAINFDMIYGLPRQTPESISASMVKALELKPDRLAVFGYAHVPWFKKNQEQLEPYGLPDIIERYYLYKAAADVLTGSGYTETGIDHFTAPDDDMTKAFQERRLHRNFQGYTTDNCQTLLGFGASAISMTPKGYLQNTPMIKAYREKTGAGLLATCRGASTKCEDKLRRRIIGELMCYRNADISELGPETYKDATTKLAVFELDGLVKVDRNNIRITEQGKLFTRLICTAFDKYWSESSTRHAKAV